jgi:hypothetical protein
MSSHQYLPLPSEGDYTRLLRLLPNESETAPLQCTLHNYSLQKSSPRTHRYEALSYVWGDPTDTLPIYIGEDQFLITANLHTALSHLRDDSFERILWVDAVCINQKDLKEQGQQVQIMAKIYSSAHRVIAWLGDRTEDTDRALEDIRLAANEEASDHSKKEASDHLEKGASDHSEKEVSDHSKKKVNRQAILSLLQRPWFQRIWVRNNP